MDAKAKWPALLLAALAEWSAHGVALLRAFEPSRSAGPPTVAAAGRVDESAAVQAASDGPTRTALAGAAGERDPTLDPAAKTSPPGSDVLAVEVEHADGRPAIDVSVGLLVHERLEWWTLRAQRTDGRGRVEFAGLAEDLEDPSLPMRIGLPLARSQPAFVDASLASLPGPSSSRRGARVPRPKSRALDRPCAQRS